MRFFDHGKRQVLAAFDGGDITSDAGAVLLRETAERLNLFSRMAACFDPEKSPGSRLTSERVNDNSELGYNGGWVRNYGVFFRDAVWRSWEKAGSGHL